MSSCIIESHGLSCGLNSASHWFERRVKGVGVGGRVRYRPFDSLCVTPQMLIAVLNAINNQPYGFKQYQKIYDVIKIVQVARGERSRGK